MSAILVAEAIVDRLQTDATLMTAIGSRVYHYIGSYTTATRPYVVVSVTPGESEVGMNGESFRFNVSVMAYETGQLGVDSLRTIFNRVYGDAMLQATRAPSYGLHRHPLVLSTDSAKNPLGWVGSICICDTQSLTPADENIAVSECVFTVRCHMDHTPGV